MKIETWDNLTNKVEVVEIRDTSNVEEIVSLTDVALGNPVGSVEWDNIEVNDDKIIAFNDDEFHPMKATYRII